VARSVFRFDARRCAKAVLPVSFVVVVAGACAVVPTFFNGLPHETQEQIVERFLWTVLILYWISLVPAVVGGAYLTIVVVRARRQRVNRPMAARLLLLCASTLICLVITETASSVWLAWAHRYPNLPTRFTAPAGDELQVVVIGGSSALGQPYQDWLSIGPIVAWKLQPALHGRRVVADVLAREGAMLEEMHQKLERIAHRPDVLIIFAGHNEFQARFPWDQDGERPAGLLPYALELVMQDGLHSSFFRCVNEAFDKYRVMAPPRIVKRQPIEPPIVRHAESERVLDDFGRRIEAIVSWCERIGTVPVLVIPPSNESGYEPNRSVLPASVSAAERRSFTGDWLTARSTELEPAAAMARYRELIARHPEFAEAYFRLGRLLERSGDYVEAGRDYRLAIDLDGFPQRCPTPFQNVYRRAAARHGCILIDGPAELRRLTPHGILGDAMINDGHHPALRGHVALAEAVLRELGARRTFGWSPVAVPSIDPVECSEHFGIDDHDWAKVCSKVATFYKMTAHIRYDPSERLAKADLYDRAARQIAAGTLPDDLAIPGIGLPRSPRTEQPRAAHAVGSTPASGAVRSGLPGPDATPQFAGNAERTTAAINPQPSKNVGRPAASSTNSQ
jgi:tetratricopeptide (TPR) repeat protein